MGTKEQIAQINIKYIGDKEAEYSFFKYLIDNLIEIHLREVDTQDGFSGKDN